MKTDTDYIACHLLSGLAVVVALAAFVLGCQALTTARHADATAAQVLATAKDARGRLSGVGDKADRTEARVDRLEGKAGR